MIDKLSKGRLLNGGRPFFRKFFFEDLTAIMHKKSKKKIKFAPEY
jgi:hypothetical protein